LEAEPDRSRATFQDLIFPSHHGRIADATPNAARAFSLLYRRDDRWAARASKIRFGARPAFTANCSSSGLAVARANFNLD